MKNKNGFSLLEILIALGIVAFALLTLQSRHGHSKKMSIDAQRLTTATFLARQKMMEIEIEIEKELARTKLPSEKEEEGEFEEPYDNYRWKYVIRKIELPEKIFSGDSVDIVQASVMELILKNVSATTREVKLTIYWGDLKKPEEEQSHLTVTTHIVRL